MKRHRIRAATTLAAAVVSLVAALPAHAASGLLAASAPACSAGPAAPVFWPWLDPAQYVLAPGGAAETADGWDLSPGASIVAGNEPWYVRDAGDRRSVRVERGAVATTGVACVGLEHPTLRFFARSSGTGLLSSLRVDVSFVGPAGLDLRLPIGLVLPTGGRWTPTLPMTVLANLLPLLPGAQTPVTFSFVPQGPGTWNVDDVHIDPFRTG